MTKDLSRQGEQQKAQASLTLEPSPWKLFWSNHPNLAISLGGTTLALVLDVVATRGERAVHWDEFQYISLARELARNFPDHLGGHYPFGYPILAAPLVTLGVSPYVALIGVSLVALAGLLYLLSGSLAHEERTRSWQRLAILLGLIPFVFVTGLGAMSELTFACLVLLALNLMSEWSKPAWIYVTVPVIVAALAVRYVGIFLPVTAAGFVLYDRLTARSISIGHATLGVVAAAAAMALLLATNIAATGYISGSPMPAGDHSFTGAFKHISDFGFGFVGLLSEGGSARLLGNRPVHALIGVVCVLVVGGLCIWTLYQRRSQLATAAAISVLAYFSVLVVLQSIVAVSDPSRYLVPVLPLLFLIVANAFGPQKTVQSALTIALGFIAIVTAARGVNAEADEDITAASTFLQSRISPTTQVFTNGDAISIAARLNTRVELILPEYNPSAGYVSIVERDCLNAHRGDYLVLGTVRYERHRGQPEFEGDWLSYLNTLIRARTLKVVYENRSAIVGQFETQIRKVGQ